MRYGMRKPSWKKSLSARTKGRATRFNCFFFLFSIKITIFAL